MLIQILLKVEQLRKLVPMQETVISFVNSASVVELNTSAAEKIESMTGRFKV